MADLEEQKKMILPFLQRAQEIQQANPKVAYYCRVYAVEQALKFPKEKRPKEIHGLLMSTLNQLEKDKQSVTLDDENDKYFCEDFAHKIFVNADRVDRASKADENTCRAYYASSIFMEILNQFEENNGDLLGRQRYAVWRAAEIRKALREGRPPLPPASNDPQPATPANDEEFLASLPPASTSMPRPASSSSSSSNSIRPTAAGQRFIVGSKVMILDPGSSLPALGTVGQILPGSESGPRYRVALPTEIIEVADAEIAANLSPGDSALHIPSLTPGVVLDVQLNSWPPVYTLRLSTGSTVDGSGFDVAPTPPPPSSVSPSFPSIPSLTALSPLPPPPVAPGNLLFGLNVSIVESSGFDALNSGFRV
jgi:vacuolar protein sorting-associated protein VTA1